VGLHPRPKDRGIRRFTTPDSLRRARSDSCGAYFFLALPSSRASDTPVASPSCVAALSHEQRLRGCRDRFANPSVTMRSALRSGVTSICRGHPRSCADRRWSRRGHVTSSTTIQPSASLSRVIAAWRFRARTRDALDPRPRSSSFRVKGTPRASLSPTPPTDFCNKHEDARARPTSDQSSPRAFRSAFRRLGPRVRLRSSCGLFRSRATCASRLLFEGGRQ